MLPTTAKWASTEKPRDLWSLAPWFIAAPLGKTDRSLPRITSTSYMNGLRGIACLIVFNCHILGHLMDLSGNPAGWNSLTQITLVNSLYAGQGMVCIFFVLSGFVLAYSPLRRINNPSGSSDELLEALASSALRRALRLFGPMIALAVITSFVLVFDEESLPWSFNPPPTLRPNFFDQLKLSFGLILPVLNPFDWSIYRPAMFNHVWTLGLEYRCSILIFVMCLMTSKLSSTMRKLFIIFVALWGFYFGHWEVYCFSLGMFIAELRFNPLQNDLTYLATHVLRRPDLAQAVEKFCSFMAWPYFLAAWIICAAPEHPPFTMQPFTYLHQFIPASMDFSFTLGSIGAVGVLGALESLPLLQRIFTTPPIQYLGEISYSVYLLHWLIKFEVADRVFSYVHGGLGWGASFTFVAMWTCTFVTVLIFSDYFWRIIDEGCVKGSRAFVNLIEKGNR